MILAQNGGMFGNVHSTASSTGQATLRAAFTAVQRSSRAAATSRVRPGCVEPDIYDLLALIAGFIAPPGLIAGARQSFMVYFFGVIHGKFDGSNDSPSFVEKIPPAISGTMPTTLEPAMNRCRR
jgi:hypothetical protein